VGIEREGEAFATVILEGNWNEADSFTGSGQAQLLAEVELGTFSEYTVFAEPSTEATVTLTSGNLDTIGGTVVLRIDDAEGESSRAESSGELTWESKLFTGSGSSTVLAAKELGTLAGLTLYLTAGSGMTANIEENTLTEIGGNVALRIDDAEGQFMTA